MALPEDKKRKIEVRKALARAEAFWGILCDAGLTRELGGKLVDKVGFRKLADIEKLTLVKVSTLLVKGANEIENAFAQAETESEKQAENQIDINQETEKGNNPTPQNGEIETTKETATQDQAPEKADYIPPEKQETETAQTQDTATEEIET